MAKYFLISVLFLLCSSAQAFPGWQQKQAGQGEAVEAPMDPQLAQSAFIESAERINPESLNALPVLNNGRIKPLQSLARETILFITGSSGKFGLAPIKLYLGLSISRASVDVQLINVRSPDLREKLGFTKSKRFYSLRELENSQLVQLAQPLMQKQEENSKSMSQEDKDLLEAFHQMWMTQQVITGEHLARSADIAGQTQTAGATPGQIPELAKSFFIALAKSPQSGGGTEADQFKQMVKAQPMPQLFQHQLGLLDLEVFYNNTRLFLIAAIMYLILGGLIFIPRARKFLTMPKLLSLFAIPAICQAVGFGMRVTITGFAPVTNMYGTMLWVSLGVGLFSALLFFLYRNYALTALLWIGSACILLLTESIPLVLSPDMDPIVAVLRSNYWLTIHVLTITISYAAFTVTMVIGNTALVRSVMKIDNKKFFEEYAKYAYRMVQLGVFLLTTGIILGGIWADYSWGRFWGWDPKETWALIADVGYLAILHARYIGWLDGFGLLAACPFAYLLVVMAWYGVNFILASGLHSYGFSSGGALAVAVFVLLQVLLLVIAAIMRTKKNSPVAAVKH